MIPITKFFYSKKLCGQIQDIFNRPEIPPFLQFIKD